MHLLYFQRMNIGLRAFFVIADNLQRKVSEVHVENPCLDSYVEVGIHIVIFIIILINCLFLGW